MLTVLWAKTDDLAEELSGLPYLWFPDIYFKECISDNGINLFEDELFKKIILEIDNADVPMKNVIRDLYTGDTHDIYKVSTGAKALWLTLSGKIGDWLIPSQLFGENCFKALIDFSRTNDILIYDDSDMFSYDEMDVLDDFDYVDFRTGELLHHKKGEFPIDMFGPYNN